MSFSLVGWKDLPIGGVAFISAKEYPTGEWAVFQPKIDESKCIKCGLCWMYCPDSVYRWDGESVPVPDLDHCKGCGICEVECPTKAIQMVRV